MNEGGSPIEMVQQIDTETLLSELDERRRQAARWRTSRTATRSQLTNTWRLRRALRSDLLRLGTAVLGERKAPSTVPPEQPSPSRG
jgi:hypothetical protein